MSLLIQRMRCLFFKLTLALWWGLTAAPCFAQSGANQSIDDVLASLGATTVRNVSYDIALPADSTEHEALGKNAVLMIEASTAFPSELPLRSTYVTTNEVRVPLQRIAVLPAWQGTARRGDQEDTYTHQIAFYLIPIYLLKREAQLFVDFDGRRDAFSVSRFPLALTGAPTFIRADDYDFPSEPDLQSAGALIVREFPDLFQAEAP